MIHPKMTQMGGGDGGGGVTDLPGVALPGRRAYADLPRQGGTKPHFPAAPTAQNEKAQAIGLG